MKIALVTPSYRSLSRGNGVTVRRIASALAADGIDVTVISMEDGGEERAFSEVTGAGADLIHCFHSAQCGPVTARAARLLGIPYIITFTGTDIFRGELPLSVSEFSAISDSGALTLFHRDLLEPLGAMLSTAMAKVHVVSQGVTVPEQPVAPPDTGSQILFLPAGIRPVKNVTSIIEPFKRLTQSFPKAELHFAGAVLEPEYGAGFAAAINRVTSVVWHGELQPQQMAELYSASAVVVNSSLSEGGMANALLEGMAFGRPLLAANVAGNRSLLQSGKAGLLYNDGDDFVRKAGMLLADRNLRQELGERGRNFVKASCSPRDEAKKYVSIYEHVIQEFRRF